MTFRLVTNSMTLSDLEPTYHAFFAILATFVKFRCPPHSEHNGDRYIQSATENSSLNLVLGDAKFNNIIAWDHP